MTSFSASTSQPPLSRATRCPYDMALEAWGKHSGMSGIEPSATNAARSANGGFATGSIANSVGA